MTSPQAARWRMIAMGLLLAATGSADPILPKYMDAPCEPATYPAYSHNDQQHANPFGDAVTRGYRGIEIDLQFVRGQLLVGHDREVTRPGFTLERYLRRMERRVEQCGRMVPRGATFWLFVDLKTKGMEGYRALRAALASKGSLFTTVHAGKEIPGPVTVVLVGWCPPLDSLKAEGVRYVSVHRLLEDATSADVAEPAHLVRLISLDARRLKGWSGKGAAPASWADAFDRLRTAGGGVEGRITRLLHARVRAGIYAYALKQGVDLIGTESLEESRRLLAAIGR